MIVVSLWSLAVAGAAACTSLPGADDQARVIVERLRAAYLLHEAIVADTRWALNAETYERALDDDMLAGVSGVVGMDRFQTEEYTVEFRTVEEGSLSFDGIWSTRIEKRSLSTLGSHELRTEVELIGEQGHAVARLHNRSAVLTPYPRNSDDVELGFFRNGVVTMRWIAATKNPVELARYAALLLSDDPDVSADLSSSQVVARLHSPKYDLTVDVDVQSGELVGLANERLVGTGQELIFVGHHDQLAFPARWPRRIYTVQSDNRRPLAVVTFEALNTTSGVDEQSFRWESVADRALVNPEQRWVTARNAAAEVGRLPSARLSPGSGPSSTLGSNAVVSGGPLVPDTASTYQWHYWLIGTGAGFIVVAGIVRARPRFVAGQM